jgi:hypothetical protein
MHCTVTYTLGALRFLGPRYINVSLTLSVMQPAVAR